MSIKAIARIWSYQGIDPRNKFVLIAYADHADHDGCNIFPAVKTVAQKTGYCERTVQRATRELEEAGLLIPDGQGPQWTNQWRLNMEWSLGGDRESPPIPSGGVTESQGCQSVTGDNQYIEGCQAVTQTVINRHTTTLSKDRVVREPLTIGLTYCLDRFSRKRFSTKGQRETLENLEDEVGIDTFKRAVDWCANNGALNANALCTCARKMAKDNDGNSQRRGAGRGAKPPQDAQRGASAALYGERWERISREVDEP